MANILFLVHRLPYPPNKGDKVRSYHLLRHLAAQHQVFLGTFVDDPDDMQYIETVRSFCRELRIARLYPKFAKIRSLNALLADEPLTLRYYRDSGLQDWVDRVCTTHNIDAAVVFSSAMAQYVESMPRLPVLIDFVDVDSAKWSQYATNHSWPMSWLYCREGKQLLSYERKIAARSVRSFLVTDAEVSLFTDLAPECAVRVEAICNGVDADYFCPDENCQTPFKQDELPIVFTGAMDYLPNIDAVRWFVADMLPSLHIRQPQVRFYVVGRSPSAEVLALADANVIVTGSVPDVRPYLQHAAVVVAPLRIARGIQNKILEAMAMARPVIASADCAAAVDAVLGRELLAANSPSNFVDEIYTLLRDKARSASIGIAARQRVLSHYSWDAHLSRMDRYLPAAMEKPR
jgi:sugar transferase (PEP-CTERM/EpsH1 system associated)